MEKPFVSLVLRGQPRGKGRPRFGRRGSFVAVWTDKKTLGYEEALSATAAEVLKRVRDSAAITQRERVVVMVFTRMWW